MTSSVIDGSDDVRGGIWPRSAMVWIVAFWMALLVIRPWEQLFPELADLHVERVYAIFALSVVLLSGQLRLLPSMQTAGIILWTLALALATLTAFDVPRAWSVLYVYLTIFAFYFVLLSVVRSPYQLVFIVACFVVSTCLFLGKSQWEYFLYGGHAFSMGVRRLRGINLTFGHPNAVAGIAVTSLPFLLFLWKVRGRFSETWPRFWRRAFPYALAFGFLVTAYSIVLTNSRAGMFGFVVFTLLAALGRGGVGRVLTGLAVVALLVGAIWVAMPEDSRHRILTIWTVEEGNRDDESAQASAEGRLVGLRLGMEMFRRYPLLGVGLGGFAPYRKAHLDGGDLVAHNIFGAVLGEMGLAGGLAFAFLVAGVFVNSRRTIRLARRSPDATLETLAGLAVACRNSIVLILFVGMFGDFQRWPMLYWTLAYCLLARTLATSIHWQRESEMVEGQYEAIEPAQSIVQSAVTAGGWDNPEVYE
jgi:hypothetical protein